MAKNKVTIKPLKIDVKGLKEDILTAVGNKIVEHAAETAPVDTGYYRSQIVYDGDNAVIAQANYSAAIEYGVEAHEIRPVNAKALHFKKDGTDVFAMRANIPARRPNPVMRNAAKETYKDIPTLVKDVLNKHGI